MYRCLSTAACVASVLIAAPTCLANGPFLWECTVTNVTGPDFDDFHATFTGTGGSIKDAVLTVDPRGTGAAAGAANMVHITWPVTDWITMGDVFKFQFRTDFPEIEFNSADLTKGGDVFAQVNANGDVTYVPAGGDGGRVTVDLVLVPAPGALAALGMAGLVATRRRRA